MNRGTGRRDTGSEALNIEEPAALAGYLTAQGLVSPDDTIVSRPLAGGVSNRTVWVECAGREPWVLKQALAKLRVQVDWFSDPRRVHREAAGMRQLGKVLPPGHVPTLLFEDHTEHIIGMTAAPRPNENWKQMLLEGKLVGDHVDQFGQLLALIHRSGYEQQADLRAEFGDDSFFEALRLEPYYGYAATQLPQAADFLHTLMQETRHRKLTLVHGDYSPKNVLVCTDQLVLLDHEVIHFGDPAFDLGFSLTHLLSKAHHLSALRASFAEAALRYWNTYRAHLGATPWTDGLEPRVVRHTLACLLARVAGRSPLEYLDAEARVRQQSAVLAQLHRPPSTVSSLIRQFCAAL